MNCAETEILICEYVEGGLAADLKSELERHFAACPACAELARDSAAGFAFMERAAEVEPPPELITRILFEAPWSKGKPKPAPWRKWLAGALSPILQPKFAMSMALTILSLSMLLRFVAPAPSFRAKDWKPSKIWASMEDRASYAWGRTVKFYDNLKFVYQIQNTLRQWQQQSSEEQRTPAGGEPSAQPDDHKLPQKASPGQPGSAPSSNPTGGSH